MKFAVVTGIVVGRTDPEVADELATCRALVSVEGSLAHALTATARDFVALVVPELRRHVDDGISAHDAA